MKKTLLSLLFAAGVLVAAKAQVVINEIMYNPPESGTDSLEFIEIYNAGNTAVDVSGWSLGGVVFTFPAGSSIGAKAYAVVAVKASAFQSVFGFTPLQWTSGGLSNSGEPVRLFDAAMGEVDLVDYKNALPWPVEGNGNGNSIVLCDPGADNNNPANWQAAATATGITINGKEVKANPNAASGCTGSNSLVAVNDNFNVPTGLSRTLSVLLNDLLPNPVTSLSRSLSS
ncbi:MAG TPA: lamin tail domain-containing protein, partial [Saprospiraceae bacterium]|nr:lamin tail domain-containing protein [Saprospiraceae bacterium]